MKIIFFGSGKIGLPSLEFLKKSGHELACVVTQPDRGKGRGLKSAETPIKEFAQSAGINIFHPENVNSGESLDYLKRINAGISIVISYGQILGEELLNLPQKLYINAHASLLPKYRGAAPINWAIVNGDKETGVTIMKMVRQMDAGPVLLQKSLVITPFDTALTLEDKLSELAVCALGESLALIEKNKYTLKEQDASCVTFAPKLQKIDGKIDWRKNANEIDRLIRGLIIWPGAFTYYKGKLLKVYQGEVLVQEEKVTPLKAGIIIRVGQDGILVGTGSGCLLIKELQLEGKKRMPVKEFIAGHKISAGESF
ncbi:MAG: methionyl-tRNA formyltransferase [Candidatus Omnitrophica bacterium]|nr:methionyl-tRNA formyltransferase [Candidatus Omnitrophota bacterium]